MATHTEPSAGATEADPIHSLLNEARELLEKFKPVLEFEKEAEALRNEDLTLNWDIQLVRGKDTPFVRMQGCSTFGYALVECSLREVPDMIANELAMKAVEVMAKRVRQKIEKEFHPLDQLQPIGAPRP